MTIISCKSNIKEFLIFSKVFKYSPKLTVETDPAEILSGQAWYNLRLTLWRGSFVRQQAARFRPPFLCKKYILLSCLGPVFWGFANQVIGKCETGNVFLCHKAVFQSSLKWIFTNKRNQISSQIFLRFPTCCLQTVQIGK